MSSNPVQPLVALISSDGDVAVSDLVGDLVRVKNTGIVVSGNWTHDGNSLYLTKEDGKILQYDRASKKVVKKLPDPSKNENPGFYSIFFFLLSFYFLLNSGVFLQATLSSPLPMGHSL